jgi:hypothetical protein
MVHYDINPRECGNVVDGPSSMTLILAEFCGGTQRQKEDGSFPSRMRTVVAGSEEMNDNGDLIEDTVLLDEKVDILHMGNVLYHILTTHSPRGKMKRGAHGSFVCGGLGDLQVA